MVQFLANIFFNKEKNIVIKFSIINTVYITHTHKQKKTDSESDNSCKCITSSKIRIIQSYINRTILYE